MNSNESSAICAGYVIICIPEIFNFLARAALLSYQTDEELKNHYKDETSILKPCLDQITSGLVIHPQLN